MDRSVLGNSSTFANRPVVGIHELFPHQDEFLQWLERLDSSVVQTLDFKSRQDLALSLGISNDKTGEAHLTVPQRGAEYYIDCMDEALLHRHLESVSRQLGELVVCLKKEFEPMYEMQMRISVDSVNIYADKKRWPCTFRMGT
jgi:hypothetical protein